jgi:hypothetical protein
VCGGGESGDQRCGAGRRKRKRERDMVDWWREIEEEVRGEEDGDD